MPRKELVPHSIQNMIRLLLIPLIFFTYCSVPDNSNLTEKNQLLYAGGFEIKNNKGFQQVIITNPWQKSKNESLTYILANNQESVPDTLREFTFIKTPVERAIVLSSTHVGFIAALGKSSTVVGVSGKDFISDTTVRRSLENKTCLDIGFAPNIDFESILILKPDVVFLYGLDPSVTALVKRFSEAGIKAVLVSEFLEDHPLGKAEWIRFFSAFYGCTTEGDSIFSEVKTNYLAWKDSVAEFTHAPKVLTGLPWKDTWYMAGGRSFAAKFIEDAHGDYLWADNTNIDFVPLDLESVFQKAVHADIWINTGSAESLQGILAEDKRFAYIPAFQNGQVYNNNLTLNSTGGNDFWESGAVRPDRVLSDLILIFHPEKFSTTKLFYYRRLE